MPNVVDASIVANRNVIQVVSGNVHDSVSRGPVLAQVGGVVYDQLDPLSRLVVDTDATQVTVWGLLDTAAGGVDGTGSTGLLVNGAPQGDGAGMTVLGGPQLFTYSGLGAGMKRLEFVNGPAANLTFGGQQRSVQILQVVFPNNATVNLVLPARPDKRIYARGTSITVGQAANTAPHVSTTYQGTFILMRANAGASLVGPYAGAHVSVDAAGSGQWFDLAGDAGKRAATVKRFVQHCDGISKNKGIFDGYETNDFGSAAWPAAALQAGVAALVDALHAAVPSATILLVTATTRSGEGTPNAAGSNLPDYRTAIVNVQSTRSAFCARVDGPSLLAFNPTNFMPDGLHLTTTGEAGKEVGLRPFVGY